MTNPPTVPLKITRTRRFQRSWKRLSGSVQRIVEKKIALLQQNPNHPSLQTHRHRAAEHLWICYISVSLRLLYQYEGGEKLLLQDVGSHVIVERAHLRRFSNT